VLLTRHRQACVVIGREGDRELIEDQVPPPTAAYLGWDPDPVLDGWGQGKSADVIATAIVRPSAEIAHGYEGTELKTKDGLTIQGVLLKEGDPLMMRSMGGITQIIPADRVASRRRMPVSLMMSAAQLGLSAQDVADLIAFLRSS
jgi:putative heme-binding domain-containing protein